MREKTNVAQIQAYEGNRPYIFVSYSHNDEIQVREIIFFLIEEGYRIWFDAGLHPATVWRRVIADKIENAACKACLFVVSQDSVKSEECKMELNYATNKKKSIIPIILQKTMLPHEIEMLINTCQYDHQATDDSGSIKKKIKEKEELLSQCQIRDDDPDESEFYVPSNSIWGPNRITYKWRQLIDKRCFNAIVDNPEIGNEENFVRIREYKEGAIFDNSVIVEVGKQYEVEIYYHNCADERFDEIGMGVAQNVLVSTHFATKLKRGDVGIVKGIISSTNTNPRCVWDSCYTYADSTVYLSYVPNSATLYNEGSANGSILHAESLFGRGARIAHSNDYWGIIPGGKNFIGRVRYLIQAESD